MQIKSLNSGRAKITSIKKLPILLNQVIHYQPDLTDYQKSINPTTSSDLLSLFEVAPHITLHPFYNDVISNNIKPPISRMKNSFDFAEKIRNLQIPPGHKIIALDVVSLFTNFQISIAIKDIKDRWSQIQPLTKIP